MGLGAVLHQKINGQEYLIACASRNLHPAEKKYSTTEKECLAVIWALQKYRAYLEGYNFTVVTDLSSLRWLQNLKDPVGRLARWAMKLLTFPCKIVHKRGTENQVPDVLSRISGIRQENLKEINLLQDNDPDEKVDEAEFSWYQRQIDRVTAHPERYPDYDFFNDQLYVLRPDRLKELAVRDLEAWKLDVPPEHRLRVLQKEHDNPRARHYRAEKTYRRLSLWYYWPAMFRDMR